MIETIITMTPYRQKREISDKTAKKFALEYVKNDDHFWEMLAKRIRENNEKLADKLIDNWDDIKDVMKYISIYPETLEVNEVETEYVEEDGYIAYDITVGFDEDAFNKAIT